MKTYKSNIKRLLIGSISVRWQLLALAFVVVGFSGLNPFLLFENSSILIAFVLALFVKAFLVATSYSQIKFFDDRFEYLNSVRVLLKQWRVVKLSDIQFIGFRSLNDIRLPESQSGQFVDLKYKDTSKRLSIHRQISIDVTFVDDNHLIREQVTNINNRIERGSRLEMSKP